ncbi:MAG: hypothetical protein CFE21_17345 [Bacteroidetes bacterium B1(2017)]|nr:MAG: hypothetical protein CFE21_17345 [Bacteroidetes bacterium B1(2017)]
MKKLLLVAGLALFSVVSKSQSIVPCATDEVYVESLKNHPELKLQEDLANNMARLPILQKAITTKYIPVVFHVIHKYGFENISQTQINDAIRVLNEDFRKIAGTNGGSSTDPLATDMQIEFRLAQFDPNGFPTNGVNRIYNLGTDNARDAQKALSYWDARKYFNVWVVNSIQNTTGDPGTILGYAQFPFQLNSQTSTDGIMALYSQCGAIEAAEIAQAGRTLTHEGGHWIGLYHTFQGGCVGGTSSNCASQGDQVCDTPPVAAANYGCVSNKNSCTNDVPDMPDQIKNYMDYSDGTCMNMYTNGQKTRADQILTNYRANIFSATNISAAGLNADGTYKTLTPSSVKAPYQFGFNVASLAGTGWGLENYTCPGDSGWQANNAVGASGSGCISAQNSKTWRTNVRNAFTSPSIDITTLSTPTMSFYVAYGKRTTASSDKLRIYISNSHGRSEVLIRTLTSTEMETAGSIGTSPFTPTATQWKRFTIDLSGYKTYTNCKVRFELLSLRGNNIFIDEFAISEPVGISEQLKQAINFNVFPNPSNDNSTISFENKENREIEISILDLQGKIMKELVKNNFAVGKHELSFNVKDMNSGLYLIEVKTPEGLFVHKLLVE